MPGGTEIEETYRALFDGSAEPTARQIRSYCGYVSRAHSWYKKLPLVRPGEPFFLHLNPHVHECFVKGDEGRPGGWRELVRAPFGSSGMTHIVVDADLSEQPMGLDYYAKGWTTVEYHEALHRWTFANFGGPGQDRVSAISQATGRVAVNGDLGEDIVVPAEVLARGLVYLRGTVSPDLGPMEGTYNDLRRVGAAPDPDEDRAAQFDEMTAAMERVAEWVYQR